MARMKHTVMVVAAADDPAALLYIASVCWLRDWGRIYGGGTRRPGDF